MASVFERKCPHILFGSANDEAISAFIASLILARHLQSSHPGFRDRFEGGEKMNYLLRRAVGMLSLILILSFLGEPTFAQKNGKKANEATQRSNDAATVFNEIMGAADNAIPKDLIDKAQAIAVFPGVLKAAFIFGGREGKGRNQPAN
jgi:hypothetical protein